MKVPALQWGLTHEDTARALYQEMMESMHSNFTIYSCGLFINPSFPHLGASPDGAISCDCCGAETKCPFTHRDSHPEHVSDPNFYLKPDGKGAVHLSHEHKYFFQVQGSVCETRNIVASFVGLLRACMLSVF